MRFHFTSFLAITFLFTAQVFAVEPSDVPSGSSVDVIGEKVRTEAEEKFAVHQFPEEVIVEPAAPLAAKEGEIPFYLDEIILEGSEIIPFREFAPLVNKFAKREVTLSQIEQLQRAMEKEYHSRGYFAAVHLPSQRLEEKILRLVVYVSKMGDLHVQGNKHFRAAKIKSYWEIPKGETLSYEAIREGVIEMNQNPDRVVKPLLHAGEEFGTTDITLQVEDYFPVHAGYSYDNEGVKLTGKTRHGFTLRHNNLLSLDDIFLIGTTFGKRFGALYLQHLIPVSSFGTKLIYGFSHSQVNPKKEFERFGINGISQTYNIMLRQNLIKKKTFIADTYVGFDFKEKKTRVLSVTTTRDRLRILSSGVDLQLKDKTGVWRTTQDFNFGLPLRGDSFALNSRGAETQFFKYEYSFRRDQKLPFETRAVLNIEGQLTHSRMMPQEQLFFGGANTVRGYPESDFLSDQGILTNLEYWIPLYKSKEQSNQRQQPWQNLSHRDFELHLLTFFDHGYGRINDPGATDLHTRTLMGVGGGLEFRFRQHFSLRVELGVPVGDRAITESGREQLHFRLSSNI